MLPYSNEHDLQGCVNARRILALIEFDENYYYSFQSHGLCLFLPKNKGNYKDITVVSTIVQIGNKYIFNVDGYDVF